MSVPEISTRQAHRAALEVARRFGDEPGVARELLDMLGLPDCLTSTHAPTSTPAQLAPNEPGSRLVDTEAAAEALHMLVPTLHRFAQAQIVRAARVDADGSRWWNLPELRDQIDSYVSDGREDRRDDR